MTHSISFPFSTIISHHLTPFLTIPPLPPPPLPSMPLPQTLAIYLEFIQHHILMGASHIFITTPFTWGGKTMMSLQRILRTFIEDGYLSMNSHADADNGEDHLYGIHGLSLDRDSMRIIQVRKLYRLLI